MSNVQMPSAVQMRAAMTSDLSVVRAILQATATSTPFAHLHDPTNTALFRAHLDQAMQYATRAALILSDESFRPRVDEAA